MKSHTDIPHFQLIATIIITLLIVQSIYSLVRLSTLSSRIENLTEHTETLSSSLASTTAILQKSIDDSHVALSNAISTEQQNVQNQLGGVKNQVGSLSGTLTTLQKLSKTDPELLKKYSKVYFLNENYVPARLSEIPSLYQYSDKKQLLIHTDVLPQLKAMISDASAVGVKLYVYSAYRSFAEQRALKGEYSVTYGAGTANSFSADQGYSEHQLGTTVDIITPGLGGALDGFDQTTAYQWLLNNAYRYGFTISYPKNNGYYVFEPWHWRFVGVKLARDLHDNGKSFYDLDQRAIDEYLVNIFD